MLVLTAQDLCGCRVHRPLPGVVFDFPEGQSGLCGFASRQEG